MHRAIVAAMALLGSTASALAADPEANKQLYRCFMDEIWNQRQPAAVDRYIASDFIEHNANIPPGLEGRKRFVASLQAGFSDYRAQIQEVIAEGDIVVARVQWTGTQDGPFLGRPATGNKLRFSTADFFRVKDGKFVEHWDVVDSLPRAVALGLVPAPKSPAPAPEPRQ
jgi:predicted ester cyclase